VSDPVRRLQEKFGKRIVGQPDALAAYVRILEQYFGGFNDPGRPIGSILELGPTGSGKTSSVEALVEALTGDKKAMIKIDCAEFQHSHEIAKLIGSPPGYLGHRETHPVLTQEAINQHQTSELKLTVLLFDEIEKASDALWNLLLGILDKATLTLGDNRRVDLSRCIIVLTSNIGASQMASMVSEAGLGFQQKIKHVEKNDLERTALSAARKKFTPEFLNRMDEIVMFNTLTEDDIRAIIELEIEIVHRRLFAKGFGLQVTPEVKQAVYDRGYDPKYNARSIRRTIEKEILFPVSRAISTGQIKIGDTVDVSFEKEFEFHVSEDL
jgi:ATP-dependent Clp protease ATP-binding subunit ClpB